VAQAIPGAERLIIAPPPCPADCFSCVDAAPPVDPCLGFDFATCSATPGCAWELAAEPQPCMCFLDENGREVCICAEALIALPPEEPAGRCVQGQAPIAACDNLDPRACVGRDDCVFGPDLDCMCDANGECLCGITPDMCLTAEDYCDGLLLADCEADPRCGPVDVCGGGDPAAPPVCQTLCLPVLIAQPAPGPVPEPVPPPAE